MVATVLWQLLIAAIFLILMNGARAEQEAFSFPAQGRNIMPISVGKALLRPCSRPAPQDVSRFWEPTEMDINNLEKQLVPYLAALQKAGIPLPPPGAYDRQFIGIVLKGKKLIYSNFFPSGFRAFDPSQQAIDVCDGGPRHWGIVFDPRHRAFSNLSFSQMG